jgi:sugar phosphate isomerase/epimerase
VSTIGPISRRQFVAMAGAAPLAASALAAQTARTVPIGLELYSVRTELTKDLMGTVRAVAAMGYQVVEFYATYYGWTVEQAKEVRELLDDLGLKCLSTHNGPVSISADGIQKAIDLNRILGSTAIIIASAPRLDGADGWKGFAEELTAAAEKLRPLGMATGFHNHAVEWQVIEGGARPMDLLAANTPRDVVLQLDVGHCVEGGADPVAWINANPGRTRSLHLKDWGKGEGRGFAVAFGDGDAPWRDIFAAAEATGGVELYLIEQEVSPPGTQLQMAQRCLDNYKKLRG